MSKASGIIFTGNGYVLTGMGKWSQKWSGFGGKVEGKETALRAAMREVLEELFNIHERPEVVSAVLLAARPAIVYRTGQYTLYILPLEAIEEKIIPALWEFGVWIPANLQSFIGGFKGTREIASIGLVSAQDIKGLPFVDTHFKKDLKYIGFL